MLADDVTDLASPELILAEEATAERSGLPLLLPATGSRAGALELEMQVDQQLHPQAFNLANMSTHDGRTLSMTANFFSQTNVYHVHERLRTELSFLLSLDRPRLLLGDQRAEVGLKAWTRLQHVALLRQDVPEDSRGVDGASSCRKDARR